MSASLREKIKIVSDKLENCEADQYDNLMAELKFLYDAEEKVIKFYSDPSHGWAAVKIKYLAELGILDDISGYSYRNGKTAYLEEDCDLSKFVRAAREKGVYITFKESHTNKSSPIRSYFGYTANEARATLSLA